jgi:hypothetical protein
VFSLFFSPSAPIGKPVISVAHNTSSNSIYLSWKPPSADEIFGEFLGYRITYHARDVKPENVNEIFIRDSLVEVSIQHIIMDLFRKHVSRYRHCPPSLSV